MARKRIKRKLVKQLVNHIHKNYGLSKVDAKGVVLYDEGDLDYCMIYDKRYRRQFHVASLADRLMANDEGNYQLDCLAYIKNRITTKIPNYATRGN